MLPRDNHERVDQVSPTFGPTGSDTTGSAWIVALTGLLAAGMVALDLRPALDWRLPWWKLLTVASLWVLGAAFTGTAAMAVAGFFLRRRSRHLLMMNALEAAAAWLLLPPFFLLAERDSGWALLFVAGVAGAMATCLRGMIPAVPAMDAAEAGEGPLFAELPAPDSGRAQAFAIAVCFECAVIFASRRQLMPAILLVSVAAFLFVWKRLTMLLRARGQTIARPAARSVAAAVLALLIVLPPLLLKIAQLGPAGPGGSAAVQAAEARKGTQQRDTAHDAYRGVILFTVHKKELLIPPVERNLLAAGERKPLIIPFDGAYWYFQAPREGPGTHAHVAQGDPVAVSIYSKGWIPLVMQAHQTLARPVDLRCCGSMQITVRNGDNRPGQIDIGVMLTDSLAPGKPSVFLGAQPIVSTEDNHFSFKPMPVDDELTFAIPLHAKIQKFDQITVVFFPAAERATLAARVGIKQFELGPR